MNLGDIYIKTFFYISLVAFLAASAVAVGLRVWRRLHAGWLTVLSLVLGVVFTIIGNSFFHHRVFVDWQQSQNKWVPQSGCLSYEPSFGHLYATYSMDRAELEQWIASYPVALAPFDSTLETHDAKRLGFVDPELAFATEMASNGKQLRVYFKDDVMFLSYNVM